MSSPIFAAKACLGLSSNSLSAAITSLSDALTPTSWPWAKTAYFPLCSFKSFCLSLAYAALLASGSAQAGFCESYSSIASSKA